MRKPAGSAIEQISRASALAMLLAVAGVCGPGSAAAEELRFQLDLVEGKLAGGAQTLQARQHDRIELILTSDRPLALHLHGYDLEIAAAPGIPGKVTFDAGFTGRFPVEVHGSDGAESHSALTYLEVYPR